MTRYNTITFTLERRLLEHPQALHIKRMRTTLFLYLALLARVPGGTQTIEIEVRGLARSLGLHEGTVRSWLGHLRRAGYITLRHLNGSVQITIPGASRGPVSASQAVESPKDDAPEFTVEGVQRALGEPSDPVDLAAVLAEHSPDVIRRALAGALAPTASEIRRSRTALFLFLLKRYGTHTPHHPRP